MAFNRRELLQAGAVAGLSTVFASQWALGAANDAATGKAAGWLPPAPGTYALAQGDELDAGAFVVEAAVSKGAALHQLTRHVFDNGFVEEQVCSWHASGVRLERLRVAFLGVGDVLEFDPPALVVASGTGATKWSSTGTASGAPYTLTVAQRVDGGELDVHRRLELRRDGGLAVVEQRVRIAAASRLPVRGSTVVLAQDAESLEWTLSG